MKDSEKVWFLYTINVGAGVKQRQMQIFRSAIEALKPDDDSVKAIFMPTETEENSVKLIYDPNGNQNRNNDENLRLMNEYLKDKIKGIDYEV